MQRQDLNDLIWFMAVARARSFTRAAAQLGTSQSTLSHTVKQLESRLGLRLLERTTRSVSATPAGERLLATLEPRLGDIERELAALRSAGGRTAGSLRLSVSDHAFHSVVWPKLKPVLLAHPEIGIEFSLDNGFRDIVAERYDAGVRLGESVEQDMISVCIGPDWRLVAVASPGYLARHPAPGVPQDLLQHDCINHRHRTDVARYAWEFSRDGHDTQVRVSGQLAFNSTFAMLDAVRSGMGIAYVPEDLVRADIDAGVLVLLLDEWSPSFAGYHLYYPSRRQHEAAFGVVVEALRQPLTVS